MPLSFIPIESRNFIETKRCMTIKAQGNIIISLLPPIPILFNDSIYPSINE